MDGQGVGATGWHGDLGGGFSIAMKPAHALPFLGFTFLIPELFSAELDVGMFLRQFKTITLPPRPLVESADIGSVGDALGLAGAGAGAGSKRTLPGAEWLSASAGGGDGDDIDYEMGESSNQTSRDDVFRARQRARRG